MPAECEATLTTRPEPCAVVALGRFSRCEHALCKTHLFPFHGGVCEPCAVEHKLVCDLCPNVTQGVCKDCGRPRCNRHIATDFKDAHGDVVVVYMERCKDCQAAYCGRNSGP